MIYQLNDNLVVACIALMNKSIEDNEYKPYDRNERCWIQHLTKHIEEQNKGNPSYIAIADFNENNHIRGFMLASTYRCYYTQELVMDVKDCIVNHDYNNAFTVARLFNYMIDHIKRYGGKRWRADSLRANDKAIEYTEFLAKKYNAIPFQGVHGTVE